MAERSTVLQRLNRRGFGFGLKREQWAVNRLDECLARLQAPESADHTHTGQQTVSQVADSVARGSGLPIVPDTDSPLRASLRRYATSVRSIRFD